MSQIVIRNGKAVCVYDDALHATLSRLGPSTIRRASHVEPAQDFCRICRIQATDFCERMKHPRFESGWMADMSPTSPVVLGPFASRTEALAKEREWVEEALRGPR